MRGTTTISFAPSPGATRLGIFDVHGARVRTLDGWNAESGGRLATAWDGCRDDGAPVPSGVYLCRDDSEKGTARGRIVVVR